MVDFVKMRSCHSKAKEIILQLCLSCLPNKGKVKKRSDAIFHLRCDTFLTYITLLFSLLDRSRF